MSALLSELPVAPAGRTGWPWTEAGPRLPARPPGGGEWPAITVVTPSFNQGAYIEATIRSVLLQGYPRLQYVIMDGGSTDDTVAVLERYAPWLDHWQSAPDGGQTAAINAGWDRAAGTAVTYLNSDDLLLPGGLAAAAAALVDPAAPRDLVFGHARIIDAAGRDTGRVYRARSPKLPAMLARWDCPLPQQGFLMRRALLDELGNLDADLFFPMDFEYWLRCAIAGKSFGLLDRELAAFRVYADSKTMGHHERYVADMRAIGERLAAHPDPAVAALAREGIERAWENAAQNAFAWQHRPLVWRYARRDLRARGPRAAGTSLLYAVLSTLPGDNAAWHRLWLGARRRLPWAGGTDSDGRGG